MEAITSTSSMIRPWNIADIGFLTEMVKSAMPYAWSTETFLDCFKPSYSGWVFERASGEPLGFIVWLCQASECHIMNICVTPTAQRQGIARQLLQFALSFAREKSFDCILLEVRASNVAAISLYKSLGFEKIGERIAYYPASSGRENACVFKHFSKR